MSMRIGQEVQALLRQRNGPLTYAFLPKMWEFHPSPSQNRTRTSARATARRLPPSIDRRIGAWGILNSIGPRRGRSDQRVLVPLRSAMTGAFALITFASSPLLVVVRSVTRAAMPMPPTIVAPISATATILRWVIRSAVKRELLFMTLIPGEFSVFHFVAPA